MDSNKTSYNLEVIGGLDSNMDYNISGFLDLLTDNEFYKISLLLLLSRAEYTHSLGKLYKQIDTIYYKK